MPTYTYNCRKCDHDFSETLRMDDRKIPLGKPCPKCSAEGEIHQTLQAPFPPPSGKNVPEFNVEVNPAGKTHDEVFKVTERN